MASKKESSIKEREGVAVSAVREAGDYLRQVFGGTTTGEEKTYLEFVSEADLCANKILISAIKEHFLEDGIFSEESGEQTGTSGFRWILDPLDGTHSFMTGFWEWGCGLAIEKDGEIVVGVCYFPMYKQLFRARKGAGAFCNNKRIRVSGAEKLRGQFFFPDSALRSDPKIWANLRVLTGPDVGGRIRIPGSFHYVLCKVALGQAVLAFSRVAKPMDVAPGAIIVIEAGGQITDEYGNHWQMTSKSAVATNSRIHQEVLGLITNSSPD